MAICILIAGPMSFSTQVLLIRARDGVHRMSIRSFRNILSANHSSESIRGYSRADFK